MKSRFKKILILATAALYGFPFLYMGLMSFARRWTYPSVLPDLLTIEHWRQLVVGQIEISYSFLLSVVLSLSVAATATIGGFITSKYIAEHRRSRWLLLGTYFPFILSPVIYAAFIYYYFVWMDLTGHVAGVFIGHLLLAYPYAIILCTGFWSRRSRKMEEVARTLGSGPWTTFARVLIPLARGILLMTFFQTFLISWFEYGLTTLLGIGKIQTLTLLVYQFITEANIYYAALSSFLLLLPPLILLLFQRRWLLYKVKGEW